MKGHGCPWDGNLTVALSNRQFIDAFTGKAEGIATGEDFDYWLYVVERQESGLHVLPIQSPSRRAAKFEFRGGTWRSQAQPAENGAGMFPEDVIEFLSCIVPLRPVFRVRNDKSARGLQHPRQRRSSPDS